MRAARAARLLLLMVAALASPSMAMTADAPATDPGAEAVAARMVARINLHRERQGLAPLRLDAALSRAAAAHARDMAKNDFFSHEGSDGSTIGVRARRAGYGWRRIAENIAGGMAEPEQAADDWMGSEGHRLNMLGPAYRDVGVGHALATPDPGRVRYRHYWTLMLGTPGEP